MDRYRTPRQRGLWTSLALTLTLLTPIATDTAEVTILIELLEMILLDGDQIRDIRFEGAGCAICMSSASLMTECVEGKTREEAEGISSSFRGVLTGKEAPPLSEEAEDLLSPLFGVREFPIRVKCATLAWHALSAALNRDAESVSTE